MVPAFAIRDNAFWTAECEPFAINLRLAKGSPGGVWAIAVRTARAVFAEVFMSENYISFSDARNGGLRIAPQAPGCRDQYFDRLDVVQKLDVPSPSTAALAWTMPYP